jgi:hypothetical protein
MSEHPSLATQVSRPGRVFASLVGPFEGLAEEVFQSGAGRSPS